LAVLNPPSPLCIVREGRKEENKSEDLPLHYTHNGFRELKQWVVNAVWAIYPSYPYFRNLFNLLSMIRKILLLLLLSWFGIPAQLNAQDSLPQYLIDGVQILERVYIFNRPDWVINQLENFPGQSVAGLLQQQTGIYIKSYGPGALASPSIRGGNAAHTQIVWNGLPVNSLMNGQTDLNLLLPEITDKIRFESGGSVNQGGTGAVSGTLQLNQNHSLKPGNQAGLSLGMGSFGTQRGSGYFRLGKESYSFAIKTWVQQAENDFPYIQPGVAELGKRRQEHARVFQTGMIMSSTFKTGKNSVLMLDTWNQYANREIPPVFFQAGSDALQQDQSSKSVVRWVLNNPKLQQNWLTGYTRDYLKFQDARSQIDSRSLVHNWIQQGDLNLRLPIHQELMLTIWGSQAVAQQQAYRENAYQLRFAIVPGYRILIKNKIVKLQLRQEALIQSSTPKWLNPQAQVDFSWDLNSSFQTHTSVASVNRIPTLNDLYWTPGGNPNLLPEQGYHAEVGYTIEKSLGNWKIHQKSEVYYAPMRNRILWRPSYNYWTASNVADVYSAGLETEAKIARQINSVQYQLGMRYQLNQTRENSKPEVQLMYIPANTLGVQAELKIKKYSISAWYSYTGFVFITSDQSDWMPAWSTADITLSKNTTTRFGDVRVFIEFRNLMNVSYQVMEGRPMPGRNYFGGIQWNWNQKRTP